jgi:CheY-like chemotaxis protein
VEAVTRILIIEDNSDAREALRALLELDGYEVHAGADGAEGLDLARTKAPEVALIDIGLPGLDGYAVARQLRAAPSGKAMFLVALTGYGQPEDRRRALEAGFDAHLVKPVEEDALLQVLAKPDRLVA